MTLHSNERNCNMPIEEKLRSAIHHAQVVSFDIFDTVVFRRLLHPHHVFQLLEKRASLQKIALPFDFASTRIQAEREARELAYQLRGSREVSIREIYDVLGRKKSLNPEICNRLLSMEIDLELQCCFANPSMHEAYQFARSEKKRIVFASDMYLPSSALEKMLHENGYDSYDFLLVSNELGASKRDGGMFERMVEWLQVSPNHILHIGDDELSDVVRAKAHGLKAFFYQRCRDVATKNDQENVPIETPALDRSLQYGIRNARLYHQRPVLDAEKEFWYRLGVESVGILYIGFIEWLAKRLLSDNIQQVYFLSRDGYILEKVYRCYRTMHPELPPSSYLYASRKALSFAALHDFNDEQLELFVTESEPLPVSHYLQALRLDPSKHLSEILASGFQSAEDIVNPVKHREQLLGLLRSVKDCIEQSVARERELVVRYLEESGFWNTSSVAIVDIGWQGSMQNALLSLLESVQRPQWLNGYYLGTFAEAKRLSHGGHNMHGYLCEASLPQDIHKNILRCVPLFEFLLSAPHGSVCGYREGVDCIEPVFEKNTIPQQMRYAEQMQAGALDFIHDYLEAKQLLPEIVLSKETAFSKIRDLVENPTCLQSRKLGDLKHVDSFDEIESARYFATPVKRSILFKPRHLRRAYLTSHWKIGFIKRFQCMYGLDFSIFRNRRR